MEKQAEPIAQPSESGSLVEEAFKHHLHGDNDKAIQMLSEFVQRWPEHIEANYDLAVCFKTAGRIEDAARFFRRTRSLIQRAQANEQLNRELSQRLTMLSDLIDHQMALM